MPFHPPEGNAPVADSYAGGLVTVRQGDCREVLPSLADTSVDSIVTDPPYELGFMGRGWDASGIAYDVNVWRECLRVAKPGAHLLAFGGTRTYHRLACAIEDAGWEIRDSLHWLQGSGFPKSKACLKPAHEPIVLARRPTRGTAPLNIDGCRVETGDALVRPFIQRHDNDVLGKGLGAGTQDEPAGRWPPNILLTHSVACNGTCAPDCPVAELDSEGDTGGASRFFPRFRYQAKAPGKERPRLPDGTAWPTVKPLALMRWLVRLVTPTGGLVLDPFAGTGTTGEACAAEGFRCVLIERDPAAVALIGQRFSKPVQATLS